MKKLNQFKITEEEFDNEIFYATYVYNQINVFVNDHSFEENYVELMSCDERPIEGNDLSVMITFDKFAQNYLQ